jgi:hypothetical protein
MSTAGAQVVVRFFQAIEALAEHAVELLMERRCAAERFPTVQIRHGVCLQYNMTICK